MLWIFLDLGRGGRANRMTPLHPSSSSSLASGSPRTCSSFSLHCCSFPFSPFCYSFPLPFPFPENHPNLFSVSYLVDLAVFLQTVRYCFMLVASFACMFAMSLSAVRVGGIKVFCVCLFCVPWTINLWLLPNAIPSLTTIGRQTSCLSPLDS